MLYAAVLVRMLYSLSSRLIEENIDTRFQAQISSQTYCLLDVSPSRVAFSLPHCSSQQAKSNKHVTVSHVSCAWNPIKMLMKREQQSVCLFISGWISNTCDSSPSFFTCVAVHLNIPTSLLDYVERDPVYETMLLLSDQSSHCLNNTSRRHDSSPICLCKSQVHVKPLSDHFPMKRNRRVVYPSKSRQDTCGSWYHLPWDLKLVATLDGRMSYGFSLQPSRGKWSVFSNPSIDCILSRLTLAMNRYDPLKRFHSSVRSNRANRL